MRRVLVVSGRVHQAMLYTGKSLSYWIVLPGSTDGSEQLPCSYVFNGHDYHRTSKLEVPYFIFFKTQMSIVAFGDKFFHDFTDITTQMMAIGGPDEHAFWFIHMYIHIYIYI